MNFQFFNKVLRFRFFNEKIHLAAFILQPSTAISKEPAPGQNVTDTVDRNGSTVTEKRVTPKKFAKRIFLASPIRLTVADENEAFFCGRGGGHKKMH